MLFSDDALDALLSRSHAYTGIGTIMTPSYGLALIEAVAAYLAHRGLLLRSGGVKGADQAFEWGSQLTGGQQEIFLPWRRFHSHPSPLFHPCKEAEAIARRCLPGILWPLARKVQASMCHQILGKDLDDPVGFVVFWAHETARGVQEEIRTPIVLAQKLGIPTFNLRDPDEFARWQRLAADYLPRCHPAENHPFSFSYRVQQAIRHPRS